MKAAYGMGLSLREVSGTSGKGWGSWVGEGENTRLDNHEESLETGHPAPRERGGDYKD